MTPVRTQVRTALNMRIIVGDLSWDYLFISASYSVIREFSKAMRDITTVIVRYMAVITLYASSERICKLSPRIFS